MIIVVVLTNQHLFPGPEVWVDKVKKKINYKYKKTFDPNLNLKWVTEVESCAGAESNCLFSTYKKAREFCNGEASCVGLASTNYADYKYPSPTYALTGRDAKLFLRPYPGPSVSALYNKWEINPPEQYAPIAVRHIGCVQCQKNGTGVFINSQIMYNINNLPALITKAHETNKPILAISYDGLNTNAIFASSVKKGFLRKCVSTYSMACPGRRDMSCGCRKENNGTAVCNDLNKGNVRYAVYSV